MNNSHEVIRNSRITVEVDWHETDNSLIGFVDLLLSADATHSEGARRLGSITFTDRENPTNAQGRIGDAVVTDDTYSSVEEAVLSFATAAI